MKPRALLFAGCALLLPATGCFFESSDSGPPPQPIVEQPVAASQLTVRWTVDEGTDPNVCAMGATSTIDITVTTTTGQPSGEFQAPCESFATTISTLLPGDYQATARLIDGSGTARTTPLSMAPFSLRSGTNLVVDINFPASSFF